MVRPLAPVHSNDVADGTDHGQRATPKVRPVVESLTDRRAGRAP
jgi:hypothetical protein